MELVHVQVTPLLVYASRMMCFSAECVRLCDYQCVRVCISDDND